MKLTKQTFAQDSQDRINILIEQGVGEAVKSRAKSINSNSYKRSTLDKVIQELVTAIAEWHREVADVIADINKQIDGLVIDLVALEARVAVLEAKDKIV